MSPIQATARPRVGLLGNPSDGYGGRVIAFTFDDFRARVEVGDASGAVLAGPGDEVRLDSLGELSSRSPAELGGGLALLAAAWVTWRRWRQESAGDLDDATGGLSMRFDSDIPRQVGLAGSSAIIIAALRALSQRFGVVPTTMELATLALAAETRELGITAGPQDRVVQAHGGLLSMDFGGPEWGVERIDPLRLPPLFVAWDPAPGRDSGAVHVDVRGRYDRGDLEVRRSMAEFARLAADGADALCRGDGAALAPLVDENFDRRVALFQLGEAERRIVEVGRAAGAAVKFTGSGGAVVGVLCDGDHFDEVRAAYEAAGYRVLRPRVTGSDER